MTIRSLQIGCLWPSEHAGGADRVMADLARHLTAHDIGVEAAVAGPMAPEGPDGVGVHVFGGDACGTRTRWMGARRVVCGRLDSGEVDLVASHFALYASAALDRLRRVPHVVHFHGPWAAESRAEGGGQLAGFSKWCIERAVYGSATRVIVLSQAFATLATRDYGVPAGHLRVVPGAADLDRFDVDVPRQVARAELGLPPHRPLIVSVRRLVHRTGVDRLLDALPHVVRHVPDVLLCVGGTGPLREQLEARSAELGLGAHVRFLGYVPDAQLPFVYRAADVNVLPTRTLEGFGLTAVEALAAGTPSMVTPIGGLPEIVTPLSADLVFASEATPDVAFGLTRALLGLVPVPDARACRAYARSHFSAELMARRVAAVYREAALASQEATRVH